MLTLLLPNLNATDSELGEMNLEFSLSDQAKRLACLEAAVTTYKSSLGGMNVFKAHGKSYAEEKVLSLAKAFENYIQNGTVPNG